jgi:uncharacterized protein (UPF0212 family)
MVMPVKQTCPECGNDFMGSDCLGQPCDDCLFAKVSKGREAAKKLGFDFDELVLKGRRCPKCNSLMTHYRLSGYRCPKGCQ